MNFTLTSTLQDNGARRGDWTRPPTKQVATIRVDKLTQPPWRSMTTAQTDAGHPKRM